MIQITKASSSSSVAVPMHPVAAQQGEKKILFFNRGEYNSAFNYLFFYLILSFSFSFVASHSTLGMIINRKRWPRGENEAEKEIIT